MDLYFVPMACSMATRIALYEIGEGERTGFHRVRLWAKQLEDGSDYYAVNPKGQVPALRLDDGTLITEGAAVLQYLADLKPAARLAPAAGTIDRTKLQIALNFIATELHKLVLAQIFDPDAPDASKAHARDVVAPRKFALLARELEGRDYLLDSGFSVADAYAFFVLTLCPLAKVDLTPWPVLQAYYDRLMKRPSVARVRQEEIELAKTGI